MSRADKIILLGAMAEKERRQAHPFRAFFTETGPLSYKHYAKHVAFFAAGETHRERCFMAGNRVGKTNAGAYEVVCHLTGLYPVWWKGKRFDHPVDVWAAGDTSQTVRDIVQHKLLGTPGVPSDYGSGMLPKELIQHTSPKRGIPNAKETVFVKHVSGGVSILTFKSYDQGRESFQGTAKHCVWADEEPPQSVYTEMLMRTMTTGGVTFITFTPLSGLSEVVLSFLPGGSPPQGEGSSAGTKFCIVATWDDAAHLSQAEKEELWNSLPPHQREARSKGIPSLGSGAIYPVPESEITVPDFIIPKHWPRAYGYDVGWNHNAAVFGALDRDSDCWYLYSLHMAGQAVPSTHAAAIKARGAWIPGVIDPASKGRSQKDGECLLDIYRDLGLQLTAANNAVEAGIYEVWQRLTTGRLKVFKTLVPWFEEFRLYRRNDKGAIMKEGDHAMDATRYLMMSGGGVAMTKAVPQLRQDGIAPDMLRRIQQDKSGSRPGPMSS